jgi:protease I
MPDRKIAFLVAAEGIERVELTEPWKAVSEAGYQPVLLSPEPGKVQTFNHLTAAETATVDQTVGDASVDDFAALVLPGGVANPDALRTDAKAVAFVKGFGPI